MKIAVFIFPFIPYFSHFFPPVYTYCLSHIILFLLHCTQRSHSFLMERNTVLISFVDDSLPELRHISRSTVLVITSTRMIAREHNVSHGLHETSWLSWLEQFKVLPLTIRVVADLVTVLISVKATYSRANTWDLV